MSARLSFTLPGGEVLQIEGPPDFVETLMNGHVSSAPAESADVLLEQGLDHPWEWFSLHAGHRMQSVNFFLVAVAFISAGYVTALRFTQPNVALGISLAGILLTRVTR